MDVLSSLKFNVMHIHFADAQMFTLDIPAYPALAQKGVYNAEQIFTESKVKELVAYAKKKGIIIIPEVDMPAHTGSWGLGIPGLAVDCWDYVQTVRYGENWIGLNPAHEDTFPLIHEIMRYVKATFDGQYMHVGGDEVNLTCYTRSAEYTQIKAWMKTMGYTTTKEIENHFNIVSQQEAVDAGLTPVVWEEVYDNGMLNGNAIVQVWSNINMLPAVIADGYKAIF